MPQQRPRREPKTLLLFHIDNCNGRSRSPAAGVLRFFGTESPGAEVSMSLDIVIFEDGGWQRGIIPELLRMPQDDLGAIVVFLDPSPDLEFAALKLMYVPHLSQITPKYDHGEGTVAVVGAEVQERDAVGAVLDAHDRPTNAMRSAHVFLRFRNG